MNELLLELQPIIYQGAVVVLTALGTYIGAKIKQYIDYKRMVEIVKETVKYVEQLGYKDELLKGQEKFEKAYFTAFKWLEDKGIPFSEVELEILIEAMVQEINEKEVE